MPCDRLCSSFVLRFLSADGDETFAIAQEGNQYIGLKQHNNDYSFICYQDCDKDMEAMIKGLESKGFMYQGSIQSTAVEVNFWNSLTTLEK